MIVLTTLEYCPACRSSDFDLVEKVSVTALARVWARDRSASRAMSDRRRVKPSEVDAEHTTWVAAIRKAIGTDEVRFDRCRDCGLEMSTPRRVWPEGEYPEDENYPSRWEFGRLLYDLGPAPKTVLELGAGRGEFLKMVRDVGFHGVGLDFSPVAVEAARAEGLDVVLGGFDDLRRHLVGRPDATFDAIAMFHAIEHLPEPATVFQLLAEFAHPGTLLGVSCPGPRRFTDKIRAQQVGVRDVWDYPPHHVLRWKAPALRAFFNQLGWDIVTIDEEPFRLKGAASQLGVTRAMFGGYVHSRWRKRVSIAVACLQLLPAVWNRRGLSLYTLARYRGPVAERPRT